LKKAIENPSGPGALSLTIADTTFLLKSSLQLIGLRFQNRIK